MKYFMGIETSCDETSVAILDSANNVLSNVTFSQVDIHKEFGGVVPEIASKNHLEKIIPVTNQSLDIANKTIRDIDTICVTNGPGLQSCLMIGVATAKTLSLVSTAKVLPVNHLEGHVASCFIENKIEFPAISLVVSGGHTNIYHLEDQNNFNLISSTLDDAAGEAFDKGAKLLGLGYPGGIEIDRISKLGDRHFHSFPIAKLGDSLDFSFSGLKTSLKHYLDKNVNWEVNMNDIASSYQEAIVQSLVDNIAKAVTEFNTKTILVCGGVACNSRLRNVVQENLSKYKIVFPSNEYCTDNGAMIAMRGIQKIIANKAEFSLDFPVFSTTRRKKKN